MKCDNSCKLCEKTNISCIQCNLDDFLFKETSKCVKNCPEKYENDNVNKVCISQESNLAYSGIS